MQQHASNSCLYLGFRVFSAAACQQQLSFCYVWLRTPGKDTAGLAVQHGSSRGCHRLARGGSWECSGVLWSLGQLRGGVQALHGVVCQQIQPLISALQAQCCCVTCSSHQQSKDPQESSVCSWAQAMMLGLPTTPGQEQRNAVIRRKGNADAIKLSEQEPLAKMQPETAAPKLEEEPAKSGPIGVQPVSDQGALECRCWCQ